jgi:transcription antitermination factor NusG
MNSHKKWYAVYTRTRWEKKVSELLTKKKIENYCPMNNVLRQWADRKKIVAEPFFSCYVFVRVDESQLLEIKQTDGIINMVYWLGRPAVINDIDIENVKHFLHEYADVTLEKTAVNINDTVLITHGPLHSQEGNVVEVMTNSVKVHLPSLGYTMVAQIRHVEKIKTSTRFFNRQDPKTKSAAVA